MPRDDRADETARILLARHVDALERRTDLARECLALLGVHVRDDDARALGDEAARVRLADPLRAARDDDDLVPELHAESLTPSPAHVHSSRKRATARGTTDA